jgi:GNAT superfamily N-acetyltransferase
VSGRYGLEIRAAGAADAAALAELLCAVDHTLSMRALAGRLEALRRQPGAVLMALEWGPPSGLIVLTWRHTLVADHPMARIEHLYVGHEHRRRGIARLLLKAGAQAARAAGCGGLEMEVAGGLLDLAAFCEAAGFVMQNATYARALRKRGG